MQMSRELTAGPLADGVTYVITGMPEPGDLEYTRDVILRLSHVGDLPGGQVQVRLFAVDASPFDEAHHAVHAAMHSAQTGETKILHAIAMVLLAVTDELRKNGEATAELLAAVSEPPWGGSRPPALSGPVCRVTAFGDTADEIELDAWEKGRKVFGAREMTLDPGYILSEIGPDNYLARRSGGKKLFAEVTLEAAR